MTSIGLYEPDVMNLGNLGIKLEYKSGVMLGTSCRVVRHGIDVKHGNRIVTAWYMRDSVHNHFRTPRSEYSKYDQVIERSTGG
jgi:hypothetical protein